MTGEMHRSEVTEETFPIHFAAARAIGGTVEPFDQYQGPYILAPNGDRLWLDNDYGSPFGHFWHEPTGEESESFPCYDGRTGTIFVAAAVCGMAWYNPAVSNTAEAEDGEAPTIEPKLKIIVTIYGGMVSSVDWPDELKNQFEVVVQDYDDPDKTLEDYHEDESGDGYVETIWSD